MKNRDAKTIVRLYKAILFLCITILLIIGCIIVVIENIYQLTRALIFIYLCLAGFLYKKIKSYLFGRIIISVLYEDMDPDKFIEIIQYGNLTSSSENLLISAAFVSGDYQTVINICSNKLANKEFNRTTPSYLFFLASSYFEVNDTAKLRLVCDKYNEFISQTQPRKENQISDSMRFFESYLDGKLDLCITTIEKWKKINGIWSYGHLSHCFYAGVIYYKTGAHEKAKKKFQNICKVAPQIGIANLSAKYIQAIENDSEVILSDKELLPDPSYSLPEQRRRIHWG